MAPWWAGGRGEAGGSGRAVCERGHADPAGGATQPGRTPIPGELYELIAIEGVADVQLFGERAHVHAAGRQAPREVVQQDAIDVPSAEPDRRPVHEDEFPRRGDRTETAQLGDDIVIGRSTGTRGQASLADIEEGVDYFASGPVWDTPTKPGRPAAGLSVLREVHKSHPRRPWFAIGGIDLERLPQVLDAGATRIAVVRAITEAADPRAAAAALKAALPTP